LSDEMIEFQAQSLEVRDLAKREIGLFIVPWDTPIDTLQGREMFARGAFDGVDPSKVRLRMDHQNPPAGKGIALEQRDDGAHMVFKVSKTSRGDEILTLADDHVSDGASVGFMEVPGGTSIETRDGRRLHARVEDPRGHWDNPLSDGELRAKFLGLAEPVLGADAARAVELVGELERPGVLVVDDGYD